MRRKKPTLAQILYEAYAHGIPSVRTWDELTEPEKERWQAVADAAEQWAYDNVQWQE